MKKSFLGILTLVALFSLNSAAFSDEAKSSNYSMPIAQTGTTQNTAAFDVDKEFQDVKGELKLASTNAASKALELGIKFLNSDPYLAGKLFEACERFCVIAEVVPPPNIDKLKKIAKARLAQVKMLEAIKLFEKKDAYNADTNILQAELATRGFEEKKKK